MKAKQLPGIKQLPVSYDNQATTSPHNPNPQYVLHGGYAELTQKASAVR